MKKRMKEETIKQLLEQEQKEFDELIVKYYPKFKKFYEELQKEWLKSQSKNLPYKK